MKFKSFHWHWKVTSLPCNGAFQATFMPTKWRITYICFIASIYDWYDIATTCMLEVFWFSAGDASWHLLLFGNKADMLCFSSFDKCQHKQSNGEKKRLTFSHYAIFIRKRHTSFFLPERDSEESKKKVKMCIPSKGCWDRTNSGLKWIL